MKCYFSVFLFAAWILQLPAVSHGQAPDGLCLPFVNLNASTSGGGEIVSQIPVGSYSGNYPNCTWVITAPPETQITFWFTYINTYTRIKAFEFDNSFIVGEILNNYGLATSPVIYSSSSSTLRITFISEANSVFFNGFRMQYNVTQPCSGYQNLSVEKGEIANSLMTGTLQYPRNKNCYWQINAPIGGRVAAIFTYMQMAWSLDTVTLYDGTLGSAVIGSFFNSTPIKYVSSSNVLTVHFHTDANSNRSYGFRLQYEMTRSSTIRDCTPINITSNSTGVIISHITYGSTLYPSDISCTWNIPQRSGYYINLLITNLQLASGDCLSVASYSTSGSPNTAYCGTTGFASASLASPGAVQISFTTNSYNESTGFSIRFDYAYLCVSVQTWSADTGEILSHSGAGTQLYMNNVQCSWLISVSPGKRVIAWFTVLNILYGDSVYLYDGISGSRYIFGFGSGDGSYFLTQGFTSSSNYMRAIFRTDNSGMSIGFRLQYSIDEYFCPNQQYLWGSGQIISHQGVGVNNYLKYKVCNWVITAPPDNNVIIRITFFSLPQSHRVIVSDLVGRKVYSLITLSLEYNFRGTFTTPNLLASSSNVMQITFYADSGDTSLGFKIEYNTSESYCRGIKYLYGESGEFQSHSAVGGLNFIPNAKCYWVITVPQDKLVILWFTSIYLNSSDSIIIYDGIVGGSPLPNISPLTVNTVTKLVSSSSQMTVFYSTSCCYPSTGFRMKFMAYSGCAKYQQVQGGSGEIFSHSEAGTTQYLDNMKCTWQIIGDPATIIYAMFSFFDLMNITDTVALYDGPDETLIIIVRGDSSGLLSVKFFTTSNILTVRFTSDSSGTGLGFRLQYSVGRDLLPLTTMSGTSIALTVPPTSALSKASSTASTTTAATTSTPSATTSTPTATTSIPTATTSTPSATASTPSATTSTPSTTTSTPTATTSTPTETTSTSVTSSATPRTSSKELTVESLLTTEVSTSSDKIKTLDPSDAYLRALIALAVVAAASLLALGGTVVYFMLKLRMQPAIPLKETNPSATKKYSTMLKAPSAHTVMTESPVLDVPSSDYLQAKNSNTVGTEGDYELI